MGAGKIMIRPGPRREMEGITTVGARTVIDRFIAGIFAIFVGPIGGRRPLILDHHPAGVARILATVTGRTSRVARILAIVVILRRCALVIVLYSNDHLMIGLNRHSRIVTG